jgi:heterotetrameric sarcosine oxidase delta subunit
MRIPCPYCGERDLSEFVYIGDAAYRRPKASADGGEDFYDAVYLRDNPAGPHQEWWYHIHGCRSVLAVTRNTRNHQILGADLARNPRP